MKKALLTLSILLMLAAMTAQAQYTYTTNADGITVTITGYTGPGGDVAIPDTINGLPVTSIGDGAFSGSSLTSVTIPDSVTSIGNAFIYCSSLTSVMIPNSVTNIGDFAFYSCYSLTAISVASQNPVYSSVDGVLFDQNQTTLIQYPTGNTATSYTIPNSVTDIGYNAFIFCTSLTSVTIESNVTNIGDYAFAYCYSLTGVYFAGDAPAVVNNLVVLNTGGDPIIDGSFVESWSTVIYYLPGSTGWSNTFAGYGNVHSPGLLTALWLPQVQTSDGSFGVRNNQFGFNITWASGQTVVVEACTDLANPVWQPVQTNTLTSDSVYFSDAAWINYPQRFYRLRSP